MIEMTPEWSVDLGSGPYYCISLRECVERGEHFMGIVGSTERERKQFAALARTARYKRGNRSFTFAFNERFAISVIHHYEPT